MLWLLWLLVPLEIRWMPGLSYEKCLFALLLRGDQSANQFFRANPALLVGEVATSTPWAVGVAKLPLRGMWSDGVDVSERLLSKGGGGGE